MNCDIHVWRIESGDIAYAHKHIPFVLLVELEKKSNKDQSILRIQALAPYQSERLGQFDGNEL